MGASGEDNAAAAAGGKPPTALLLCPDLMFAVSLQNVARAAGFKYVTVRPGVPLPPGELLVVDLASRVDWEQVIREAAGRGTTVIAFGPHMDADARKRAKAAGAARVLANSNLARDLPGILRDMMRNA